jgi:acetyl-CoA carboxylase biotin carboxyl carrier protein
MTTDADLRQLRDLGSAAQALIERLPGAVRRISLCVGEYRVEVDWEATPAPSGTPAPAPAVVPAPVAAPALAAPAVAARAVEDLAVTAPLVGTFYRGPAPGQAPFVAVGDVVEAGQQLAIVEAMKLLTPVTAPGRGVVAAVHVPDGEMVEFDQPLLSLTPTDG